MTSTAIESFAKAAVHCEKCGRQVDEWTINWVIVRQPHPSGYVEARQTGEVIVTVKCHGETWRISNRRGKLD